MSEEDVKLISRIIMLNRPPPYFPQNQLSPPDPNRYRKFKLVVAGIAAGSIVLLAAVGLGIYYLITWLMQ